MQKGPDKGVKDTPVPWHVPQAELRFPLIEKAAAPRASGAALAT